MARPPGYCLPPEGGSGELPTELRAELTLAIADRDRARAQRDFLQHSLEQLRAAFATPREADARPPSAQRAMPDVAELTAQRDEARREAEMLRWQLAETRAQLAAWSAQRNATRAILDDLRLQVAALEEINRSRHDGRHSTDCAPECLRVELEQRITAHTLPDRRSNSTVDPPKPRPAPARRNWRTTALVASAGLTLTSAWLAVTRQPDWYHPRPVDRATLRADKMAFAGLLDNISTALNGGHEIRFRLDEEQVNRWLAARAELLPETIMDLGTLEDPQVSLADGEIRVAATTSAGHVRAVLALACRVEPQEERVTVRYTGPRLGLVPLPASWLPDPVNALATDGQSAIRTRAPGVVTLNNDWLWPNGKRRCRLRELHVVDGAAEVVVEPIRR